MRGRTLLTLGLIVAVIVLAFASTYTVAEYEQVILTQFGEIVGSSAVTTPGLHVRLPFVQDVHRFEKRWLEWDGAPNQIPTRDKKYIWVDAYARWRVSDPRKFFKRLHDETGAQSRLDDIIDGEIRNVIAAHDLIEVVRASSRTFELAEDADEGMAVEAGATVRDGRDKLTRLVLEKASSVMPDYGIELADVQFKRINYVDSVQAKVFDRMISERKRIAERYRSEGQGKSAEVRGKIERELKSIQSEAYKRTQEIRGKADAQAASIYAAAYSHDAELYRFLKSLEAYKLSIDRQTTLILSTDSELLRYLKTQK